MRANTYLNEEIKLWAVKRHQEDNKSVVEVAAELGVDPSSVKHWIDNYQNYGAEGLRAGTHQTYGVELKEKAVKEYLSGGTTGRAICQKYKIKSQGLFRDWIKQYTDQGGIKPNRSGGNKMKKGRTTTKKERIEIVEYFLTHERDYKETARIYCVSSGQIRSWVKKYETQGAEGLIDGRGRIKPQEELTEVEKLRSEIRLLKAENQYKEWENLLLKKVKEIERRRS